jgi:hypothetical protein
MQAHPGMLPDGRRIRALDGTFGQRDMFRLRGALPKEESLMNMRELAASGAEGWWRSGRYGVLARGFEKLSRPIGARVVWVESGLAYSFEVPDVRHPSDRGRCLREADGLLDFDLLKLEFDEASRTVSAAPGFDPVKDVAVRDVRRSNGWALPDAEGFPARSLQCPGPPEALFSCFAAAADFSEGSSGWHGSVAFGSEGGYMHVGSLSWNDRSMVGAVRLRASICPGQY